ncbi:hypothetical protein A1OK_12270 [Enterovibrio norvegicus FF-454]|uniref:Protein TonB n=1 Tax=Enterovibrio norvegicus FF-454 TaxID=1185651 RepID=A0A1E5C3K3_9GAMM|nr:energy transducer TonB [Enterovibrio norvegicus]OEE60081.1 hypothetical protein A1OK_12270 [Enterovibrio norvegicus FF-454]
MLRWILAVPVAGLCVLALFALMAAMVEPSRLNDRRASNSLAFDLVMVEPESELTRRERLLPPKPEPPPQSATPLTPVLNPQVTSTANTTAQPSISELLPDIAMDISVTGFETSLPVVSKLAATPASALPSMEVGTAQAATPTLRVEARYPAKALKRGIEGYVVISFTINEKGRPTDLKVVDSKPKRMFDREALRALKKWKYAPQRIGGQVIAQQDQTVKFDFTVAK